MNFFLRELPIFILLCAVGLVLAYHASGAYAQAEPSAVVETLETPEQDVGKIAALIIDAAKAGEWLALGALVLMLIGMVARRVVAWFAGEWVASKTGGKVIGAGSAFASALGAAVYASGFSLEALLAAISAAGAAAGFWSLLPSGAKNKARPQPSS